MRWWTLLVALLLAGLAVLVLLRPEDQGGPHTPYFAAMQSLLRSRVTEGAAVLDMQRVRANVEALRATGLRPDSVRLVAKSVPSQDLLLALAQAVGTRKIMVFHLSFLDAMLRDARFAGFDFLWGLTVSRAALQQFPLLADPRVQWLADCMERLQDMHAVATQRSVKLRVSLEIDVGLHRGGFYKPQGDFQQALRFVAEHGTTMTLTGTMGYDGHVQGATAHLFPASLLTAHKGDPFGRWAHDVKLVDAAYRAFVQAIPGAHDGLTFNGAGSSTKIALYGAGHTPLNDFSCGSWFTKPGHFDLATTEALQPALFTAGVVIKRLDQHRAVVPFLPVWAWNAFRWWNVNFKQTFYVEGAGMPGTPLVSPPGVRVNPLEEPNTLNLFPTQSMTHASFRVPIALGDLVFSRCYEADCVLGYQNITVVDGLRVSSMGVFRGGV